MLSTDSPLHEALASQPPWRASTRQGDFAIALGLLREGLQRRHPLGNSGVWFAVEGAIAEHRKEDRQDVVGDLATGTAVGVATGPHGPVLRLVTRGLLRSDAAQMMQRFS